MSFSTAIQSLTGAHSEVGGVGVDWLLARVYEPGGAWLARYGLLSGLEEAFVSTGAIGMPSGSPAWTTSAGNVLVNGGASAAFNGGMQVLDPALARISAGAFSGGSYGGGDYASVLVGSQQYYITTGTGAPVGGTHSLVICRDTTQIYRDDWPAGANGGALCSGVDGSNVVFSFTGPTLSQGGTQQITVQEYTCGLVISKRTLVNFTPTAIDAAWTQIYFGGGCVDQTDGNILLFLGGQSGATALNYLLKISAVNGSVVWKSTVNSTSRRSGVMMSRSSVKHGKFGYVSSDSPKTITVVDTSNGSSVTQTTGLDGLGLMIADGAFNDSLGCVVGWYDYSNNGADSPARLNATAGIFNGMGVLYITSPFIPPPVSGGRKFVGLLGPVRTMTLGPAGTRGTVDLDIEVAGVTGHGLGADGAVSLDIAVAGAVGGGGAVGAVGLNIAVVGVVGGATGGLLKTLQVENFGGADSSPESHTPMFGLGFKEGDMPAGQWPVLKTAGGTVVPYSAGARGSWPDESLKFLPGLARFPDQITGLAQASLRVFAGGSAPVPSSRTLAEIYALNISVLGNGGLDNISGDWTCALQAANVISVTVVADGPAGKVWEFLANFNRLGSAHGQLVTVFYLQALEDAGGLLAGVRILPRITQPWYDWDTPPKNFRSFTSLQLQYGPVGTIYDAMANSYSAKTFTWENAGSGGDLLLSTGYGYPGGLAVRLSTTGVLPAGLSANTTYWIAQNSSNDFYFADGASVGSINNGVNRLHVTSFGTGTHTMTPVPYVSHFCSAWIATSEAKYVWLNGVGSVSSEATLRIRNDVVYDHSTRILPPYDLSIGTVANNASYFWGPYAVGPLLLFIGTTGERGDIGVLSAYHSRHFYTQAAVDERLARIIGLAQGNLPTNLRDHTLRNLLNFSNNSYFGMSASVATTVTWRPGSVTAGFTPPLNPSSYTQCFSGPDESHQTQFSAYPYFITGEPQFYALLKEASGEANFGPPPNDRNATVGGTPYYGIGPFAKDSFRSGAWCFREIVWTAVLSPDSDPDGSGFSTYIRDLAAAQFSYLAAWNLANSSWWNTNGFWAPQSCGNARASWQVGYVWSVVNLGAGGLHNSDALAMSFHLAKWPVHVNSLTGNTWCLGSYYEISSSSAGVQGAPYITGDLLWGPFSPNSGLSWTNAGDLLTWSGTNFVNGDGDKLVFWANAPTGLSLMTPYYAVSTSGTSFQLAASPGGSALAILADGAVGDSIYLAAIPASPPVGGFVGSGPGYSTYGSIQQGNVNWAIALGATGLSAAAADLNARQAGAPYGLDPRYTMQTTF